MVVDVVVPTRISGEKDIMMMMIAMMYVCSRVFDVCHGVVIKKELWAS